MKQRLTWTVLAAVTGILGLSGCQSAPAKAVDPALPAKTDLAAVSPVETVATQVVHTRDPKTGRMVLTSESATTTAQKPKSPPAEKPPVAGNVYQTDWQEDCTVQQAFLAGQQVLEELELSIGGASTRTVRTRDPKTGRTVTKSVPSSSGGKSDELSAILTAGSVAGIKHDIKILLQPPASCQILIRSESDTLPKGILKAHGLFLKDKISQAIRHQPAESEQSVIVNDVRDTIVLERSIGQVYDALSQWAGKWGFNREGAGGDLYSYYSLTYQTGSGIRFVFQMRIVDSNKTKLEIAVESAEGKDEYTVIRRSLDEALQGGGGAVLASYTDTQLLDHRVGEVMKALRNWATGNRLDWDDDRSDVFYSRAFCSTASEIRFSFTMRLVEPDKTRLEISADKYDDKGEFPVILKSLKTALEQLDQPTEAVSDPAVQKIQAR